MGLHRKDALPVAAVCALAFALHALTAVLGTRAAELPLPGLAVYFDGNVYLEIAKSFPLPYAPAGGDYVSHAPGYPGLVHLLRVVTAGVLDWGALALLASWIPAALAAGVFYALCRELGVRPFWPSVAFVVGQPRWWSVAATAHAESLAALFALLTLVAYLRGRLGWAMAWLALAGLTRFPALLLGLPLAFDALFVRRRRDLPTLARLAVPVAVFGLLNLYLAWRVPGFSGLFASHAVHWRTGFGWPFAELWKAAAPWARSESRLYFELTYLSLALYLASVGVGLRSPQPGARLLAGVVAVVVGFHVCLAGAPAAWDFTRLTLLAWPPALLVLWQRFGARLPNAAAALLCTALAVVGLRTGLRAIQDAVAWQNQILPYLSETIRRLDDDEPRWIRFGVPR